MNINKILPSHLFMNIGLCAWGNTVLCQSHAVKKDFSCKVKFNVLKFTSKQGIGPRSEPKTSTNP